MNSKIATINVPLAGLKPLYRDDKKKTLVCEVDVDELKKVTEPETLDEVIRQSHLDYAAGDYKGFDNVEDLINDLKT